MSRYWSVPYAVLDMNAVGIAVEARRAALEAISSRAPATPHIQIAAPKIRLVGLCPSCDRERQIDPDAEGADCIADCIA